MRAATVPTEGHDAGRERAEVGARPWPLSGWSYPTSLRGEPSNRPGGDPQRAKIGAWPLIC